MDEAHLWQWMLLLVGALWGFVAVLTNPDDRNQYTRWRLRLVNFLLFLTAFTGVAAALRSSIQPESSSLLLIGAAVLSGYSLSLAAAIHLPFHKYSKALYVIVIVVLPLLATGYALREPAVKEDYFQYMEIVGEDAVLPKGSFATAAELVPFYFVRQIDLVCTEGDQTCEELARRLTRREAVLIFIAKVLFWFSCIFSVLRYYGTIFKVREEGRHETQVDYDLRGSVIAQSASVLSCAIALFVALFIGGVDFAQLGLFGGLIGAGVSVALRDTLGNFAAGILLLWDGTIKKGDVVTIEETSNPETGGTYGIVKDMRPRYTLVKDRDTVHRLIPNSILINSIVENWTHDSQKLVRLKVKVPIPYGSPIREIRNILESSCYEVVRVLPNPAPKALVTQFADSAMVFSLRFWITDPENGIRGVISEVYTFVSERLADIGVTIPYPQMDIHVKDFPASGPIDEVQHPGTEHISTERRTGS